MALVSLLALRLTYEITLSKATNIYYCNQCKKFLSEVEDLFFVEEQSNKGFCSESCIEKFYDHLVKYFEKEDNKRRVESGLAVESCLNFVGKPKLMEIVLASPHEVWEQVNDLDEKYYYFIRRVSQRGEEPFHLIVTCMIYANKPSFILAATATRDENLLSHYQVGKRIENTKSEEVGLDSSPEVEGFQSVEIEKEVLEAIELKKSQYLANLLEDRSPSDVPFEKFILYDEFAQETLQNPDEVYKETDDEGDLILTYIKAHELNGISFYYFCICMKYDKGTQENLETLLPIITFPTLDGEIYESYKKGTKLTGALKN